MTQLSSSTWSTDTLIDEDEGSEQEGDNLLTSSNMYMFV